MRRFACAARALCAAAILAVAGCDESIGEGSGPVDLTLATPAGSKSEPFALSECGAATVAALLHFDGENGASTGDYTTRVEWSSDAPGIAAISDGTLLAPDGTTYAAGTVIARGPGVAQIRAAYLDFVAVTTVTVRPLQDLYVEPALTDIAQDLTQQFHLQALADGDALPTEITGVASWRFTPPTASAYIEAAGLVQANSANAEPLTLVAELPQCGRSARAQFRISAIDRLDLEYELGDFAALPIGTSESLEVWAVFADPAATRQNVSGLMDVDNNEDEVLTVARTDERIVLLGLDEVGGVSATLSLYEGALSFATRPLTFVETELDEIAIVPETLDLTYPDEGQLEVLGYFENGLVVPITRHVTWVSGDGSVLAIGGEFDDAGVVTVQDVDQDVEVEARADNGITTLTATGRVRVERAP